MTMPKPACPVNRLVICQMGKGLPEVSQADADPEHVGPDGFSFRGNGATSHLAASFRATTTSATSVSTMRRVGSWLFLEPGRSSGASGSCKVLPCASRNA